MTDEAVTDFMVQLRSSKEALHTEMSGSMRKSRELKASIRQQSGMAAERIKIRTQRIRKMTSHQLKIIEQKFYRWLHELNEWKEEQLDFIEETPSVAKRVVDSITFSALVFVSISLNAIITAIGVNARAEGLEMPEVFSGLDKVVVAVYVIEASLRLVAYGRVFFFDPWNLTDVFLLLIEFMDMFILAASTHILLFRVFRSMRLLRLLRSLRIFHQLRVLWNSYLAGMVSLFWANVLLFLFTFICACFLTDILNAAPLATGDGASMFVHGSQEEFVKIYFGSIMKSMVTLFQVCTLESWANGIMRPAEAIVPGLQWVFIAYVMLMTFGLVNMIVGVFVEHCAVAEKDEAEFHHTIAEEDFKEQLEYLQDLFQGYDQIGNKDGKIGMDEFREMSTDPRFLAILDGIPQASTPTELFEALDINRDGRLEAEEFFRGLQLCKTAPNGLDLYKCSRHLQEMRSDHTFLSRTVESLAGKVDLILTKLGVESPGKVTLPGGGLTSGSDAETAKSSLPVATLTERILPVATLTERIDEETVTVEIVPLDLDELNNGERENIGRVRGASNQPLSNDGESHDCCVSGAA
jgi:voltage-gated sodium channel